MPLPNDQGIGTTPFFFIPRSDPHTFEHGDYYFLVKLHLARVILTGGWWKNVTSVALASAAKAEGDPTINAAGRSLNQAVRVNQGIRNRPISCRKNIVDLVPATMSRFNVEVQLVATRRDPVEDFFTMVQQEAFAAAFSFVPGPLAALKTLGPVVPSLLKVFQGDSPKEEPALLATEDLNVGTKGLQRGFLVTLSSMGENGELNEPIDPSMLEITGTDVLLNGHPVVQACYVVLEIDAIRYRGIGGTDSQWVDLYEQTMRLLEDALADIGDVQAALSTALKALYALDELQSNDLTFTKGEMAIYRKRLRDKYLEVKSSAVSSPLAFSAAESLREELSEDKEVTDAAAQYETELTESMRRLARFEREKEITLSLASGT